MESKKKTANAVKKELPKVLDIPTAVNALMAEAAGKSLSVNNITMSIDGLEAYVNETLPNYAPEKYTGDADAAKKDRAILNGGLKQIADARKQIIAKAMEPYKALETRMKNLEKQMQNGSDALDAIVKVKENAEKEAKRKICLKIWESKLYTLITFEQVFSEKWLNKTTKAETISDEMDAEIEKTKQDIKAIEALPEDADTVKAIYLQNRDMSEAMRQAQILKENRQRAAAEAANRADVEHHEQIVSQMHDECTEYFEQQKSAEPETLAADALGVDHDTDPVETYTLEFTGKKSELIAMRTYMSEHGITYRKIESEGAY